MCRANCGRTAKRRPCHSGPLGRTLLGSTSELRTASPISAADMCRWNQSIILPITYPSLLLSSQIAFTIWDVQGAGRAVPIGGTTMSLFNSKRYVPTEVDPWLLIRR